MCPEFIFSQITLLEYQNINIIPIPILIITIIILIILIIVIITRLNTQRKARQMARRQKTNRLLVSVSIAIASFILYEDNNCHEDKPFIGVLHKKYDGFRQMIMIIPVWRKLGLLRHLATPQHLQFLRGHFQSIQVKYSMT